MPTFIVPVGGRGALLLLADASSGGRGLYSERPADGSVCAALPFEFLYGRPGQLSVKCDLLS